MITDIPNWVFSVNRQSPCLDGEQLWRGCCRWRAPSRLCLCVCSPSVKALKKLSSTCCPDCFSHRFTTVCTCLRCSRWGSPDPDPNRDPVCTCLRCSGLGSPDPDSDPKPDPNPDPAERKNWEERGTASSWEERWKGELERGLGMRTNTWSDWLFFLFWLPEKGEICQLQLTVHPSSLVCPSLLSFSKVLFQFIFGIDLNWSLKLSCGCWAYLQFISTLLPGYLQESLEAVICCDAVASICNTRVCL